MAKDKKQQQQAYAMSGPKNFLGSPAGKGVIAAGVVALAGLLFSKDKRAQGARDSLRGAADRMRTSVGNALGSSPRTTTTPVTPVTGQSSGDGITAH